MAKSAPIPALRGDLEVEYRDNGTVEIPDDDVDVYSVADCLRPYDVHLTGVYRRSATLDDVFLELTGKQLRE